jgi:NADP-dependent 3-hydroxy acid dehydrogenase YdfG
MSQPAKPVALITGASSGIGFTTAQLLNRSGFVTYATARRLESVQILEKAGCKTLQLDVTEEKSMCAAVETIIKMHGAVDILVNNAGYGLNGPIEELELSDLRLEFETNLFGLIRLSQLVLPGMRDKGWGRIINIGSVGGSFTAPGSGAYHASKYALESITDALRYEVQQFGVDVVLLKPTGVYTKFDQKIINSYHSDKKDSPYQIFMENHARVTNQMFKGRNTAGIIKPEDVARVVLQAIQAHRPKTRYNIGFSAHIYLILRRILSDRAWDAMMLRQFPMK